MSQFLSFDPPNVSSSSSSFNSKVLILPIVSAANVPQLAADILIATFSLSRIAVFDPRYHIPIVGAREGGASGVTTPLELFGSDAYDFVVIQQRSPVLKTQKDAFVAAIVEFVTQFAFKSVIFATSVDSTYRADSQMGVPLFHFIPPSSHTPAPNSPLAQLVTLFPPYTINNQSLRLPNGGLTKRFVFSLQNQFNAGFLIWVGMEGDNREDAQLVAAAITKLLSIELKPEGWKYPESWKQGLFGTPNDQTLYG